jgi:hypothetical protein
MSRVSMARNGGRETASLILCKILRLMQFFLGSGLAYSLSAKVGGGEDLFAPVSGAR